MPDKSLLTPTGRALEIIEMAASRGTVTVSDVVMSLGIPKPTAHRIVGALEEMGFLNRAIGRGKYIVAPRLVMLASNVLQAACVYSPAHALLVEVARLTVGTCSLAIQQGGEIVYIDSAVADSPLMLGFQTGQRAPLYCTSSGRIFLSYMDRQTFEAYLETGPWQAHTVLTITEPQRLREEVEHTAHMGLAMTDSEYVDGVLGAAVAVLGPRNKPIAALTISIPRVRSSLEQIHKMVPFLKSTAKRLSTILVSLGS